MKILKKTSLIAAAVALTATPVIASAAQPAVGAGQFDMARADAEMTDANQARSAGTYVIGLLALAAIIAAIIIAADGNDDTPTSP
ncbi:MAG: hypothetical protein GW859_10005 [Sphingomonadales bacterium]|nr:hypothetical protein [Sphingomonadales bacterium]